MGEVCASCASFPPTLPPEMISFVGCSAGAAAVIVTEAARASRAYPTTKIVAVGVSPTTATTESFAHEGLAKWGVGGALDELNLSTAPLRASVLTDTVSIVLSRHPATRLGFYSSLSDSTARSYWIRMNGTSLAASPDAQMASWRRNMIAGIEVMHRSSNFRPFLGSVSGHCHMTFDTALTNDGFAAWLNAMLGGSQLPSSSSGCASSCSLSTVAGCDGSVGSRALEDRCGVCNGDGMACASRSTSLCSCAGIHR